MTCLDDERLTDMHFGGGSPGAREHTRTCAACGARLARLGRDLARVEAVLRTTAPPRRVTAAPSTWRWAPLAAAAVLAVAIVAGRGVLTTQRPRGADVATLADELTDALTADVSFDDGTTPASTCAWGDPLLGVGCEDAAVLQVAWR